MSCFGPEIRTIMLIYDVWVVKEILDGSRLPPLDGNILRKLDSYEILKTLLVQKATAKPNRAMVEGAKRVSPKL